MTNNSHAPVKEYEPLVNYRLIRLKAYKKFLVSVLGACAALYELVTGEQAPKAKDVLTIE